MQREVLSPQQKGMVAPSACGDSVFGDCFVMHCLVFLACFAIIVIRKMLYFELS